MKIKINFILLLAIISFLFVSTPYLFAAPKKPAVPLNSQFTVTPAVFEHVLQPGQSSTQVFQLSNKSQLPLPIKSYVRAFDASDEVGGVNIQEDEDRDIRRLAPTSWVNLETKDFIIQPQSILKVNVTFNPPRDLPPGGYYAIIFFEPQLPESFIKDNNSLQINGRVGALLFLVGAGDVREKGQISSFSTDKWKLSGDTATFKASFLNNGNVHLRPSGKLTVKNLIPFIHHEKTTNIAEVTVLPNKTRQLNAVSYNFRWPGIYSAKITLNFGKENQSLTQELTFFYLPWKYILSFVLLILFVVFISKRKNRLRIIRAIAIIDGKRKIR